MKIETENNNIGENMERRKEGFRKRINNNRTQYITYALLLTLLVILHWNMSLNISDDALWSQRLHEMSLLENMRVLYFYTNGRVLADTMAAIFTYLPPAIWKCLNICALFSIVVCVDKLFLDGKTLIGGCAVILLLPFSYFTSAGYCASSTNYTWSAASLLISLLPLKYSKVFFKHKYMYVICIFSTIYATNQDQTGLVLITTYILFFIYKWYKHEKINLYNYIQAVIAILGLLILVLAPGHQGRMSSYNIFNVPDFIAINSFQKLIRGFTFTIAQFLDGKRLVWPLLCGMLFITLIACTKNTKKKLIMGLLFAASLVLGPFQDYLLPSEIKEIFNYYPAWGYGLQDYRMIDAVTYTEWKYYVPIFFSIAFVGIMCISFFWVYGLNIKGICVFLIFAAGFASRVIMGFAPSTYGSSFRTSILCNMAFSVCIAMLYEKVIQTENQIVIWISRTGILVSMALTYYNSLIGII